MAILQCNNILKKFGGLHAVDNINFSTEKGEILGIIGPNGAGKTTLTNVISGTLPLTAGEVIFKEQQIGEMPAHEINRLGIARTFQTIRPLEQFAALENIMIGALFGNRLTQNKAREKAREICDFINFDNFEQHVDKLTVLELKKIEL